jgi:hypothetical protein
MIYLVEICGFLLLLLICFFVYRALIRSASFTRFIEGSKPSDAADAEAAILAAEENASTAEQEYAERIRKDAAALRSLKRRTGK